MTTAHADQYGPAPTGAKAVRAALSREDQALFDTEYERALAQAQPPLYDLAAVLDVVEQWRRRVALAPGDHHALEIAQRAIEGLDVDGLADFTLDMVRSG